MLERGRRRGVEVMESKEEDGGEREEVVEERRVEEGKNDVVEPPQTSGAP